MAGGLKCKGRSFRTNKNKLRRLKKFYQSTYSHSKENHKQNEEKGYKKPDFSYFFMRYPDEKSFLVKVKIKDVLERR